MTALDSTPIPALGSRPSFQKLRELVYENPNEAIGWDNAWRRAVTPWNAGKCQPPLEDLIHSKILDLPRSGRALVPGCGRGYETAVIANMLDHDTVGLDISPTAIQHAKTIHADFLVAAPGKVAFEVSDFFKYTVPTEGRFDLIFDYLFFVAITPDNRKDWGSRINALIKPGGYLVALVYPIEVETDLGPPYFVRPKHYTDNLGDGWSVALDIIPKTSLASHIGVERLVAWKKCDLEV